MEGRGGELAVNLIWVRFKHPNRVFPHPPTWLEEAWQTIFGICRGNPLWGSDSERSGQRFLPVSLSFLPPSHPPQNGRRSEWIGESDIR